MCRLDALLEFLTAKEHLELFAAIKGIPYHLRARLVQQKLIEMNLKKFENVCAGTYSGGNKRKLQVAIAMIGKQLQAISAGNVSFSHSLYLNINAYPCLNTYLNLRFFQSVP